jgi:transcriptional regulator with XRE-family HTH domain
MSPCTHIVDFQATEKVYSLSRDLTRIVPDTVDMDSDGPNHLKAWRKFRRMTQQALADAIEPPTTKQVIQAIESGARGLSDKWLRRLAPALGTTPGFLLDYSPDQIDSEYLEEMMAVPAERRAQALAMLKLLRTGTDG